MTGGIPSAAGELADGQNGPAYPAVDNGTVYWIDSGAGTIMAVPAVGGTPSAVTSSLSSDASYLAVSG